MNEADRAPLEYETPRVPAKRRSALVWIVIAGSLVGLFLLFFTARVVVSPARVRIAPVTAPPPTQGSQR